MYFVLFSGQICLTSIYGKVVIFVLKINSFGLFGLRLVFISEVQINLFFA